MWRSIGCAAALACTGTVSLGAEPSWRTFEGCTLVRAADDDGDSFEVEHKGERTLVRLYFVDTFEREPEARERRAGQGRYFGLAGADTDEQAIRFASDAADFTRNQLSRPFTVVTRNERVDPEDPASALRAFVRTSEGRDLAEELVRNGLALVRGGKRSTSPHPDGRSADEVLRDLRLAETEAHRAGRGAWAHSPLPEGPKGPKTAVLPVTSRKELLALAGERVRVKGRINRVATLPDGRITFLNFENTGPGDFVAIVRAGFRAGLEDRFPAGLPAALVGRDVLMSGVITVYRDAPQMEIEDAAQIEILPATASH